ncbi:hypothetical protein [Legionella sp. CNM-4043-24]|uniref:hypothetical protein n=1 Tax=Legionella sp. CNM-4043-24 TaxID=3421646 RepID=UPI00403ABFE3
MRTLAKLSISLLYFSVSSQAFSFALSEGKMPLQVGVFHASQGAEQHIDIKGLIGDQYTLTKKNENNLLLGLGYFINGPQQASWGLSYGIDAFYLARTSVQGQIIQENLFNNLSYQYKISNVPVYAAAKAEIKNGQDKYALTLDAGIGPNFINTSSYHENSLDGGITIPGNVFSGKSHTAFSAMGGVGIKINNLFGHLPFECGYRFFYLGEGRFNGQNSQLLSTLKTGNNYAQALVCAVTAF